MLLFMKIGNLKIKAIFTPGHYFDSICYLVENILFTGDTLFVGRTGRTISAGSDINNLYDSIYNKIFKLPGDTYIYPGHDYIVNNLNFTLDREPNNEKALNLKSELEGQDTNNAFVTNLGIEKEINTFFRLQSPTVHSKLRDAFPDLPDELDEKTVFLKLRELRNVW